MAKKVTDYQSLINEVKNKRVHIAAHWDADGVSSGAIIYHLIKRYTKNITYHSKGEVFLVENSEIDENADMVISTDIQTARLDKPLLYIDHHPIESESMLENELIGEVHDTKSQSCSLLIYETFLKDNLKEFDLHEVKYFLFLTLIGYFGDAGDVEDLPINLYVLAKETIPELMKINQGYRTYLEIQKYVSLFNVSKRVHWDGELAIKTLIKNTDYESIIYQHDPMAKKLFEHKKDLKKDYKTSVDFKDLGSFKYSIINHKRNIQGVICARYLEDTPLLVLNTSRNKIIGSMRVPDHLEFNAGEFLEDCSSKIESAHGGGHEKAGGISFNEEDLEDFIDIIRNKSYNLLE